MNESLYYGKIKFYDYRKNHFGFIYTANCTDGNIESEIHIRVENLVHSPERYRDETPVIFYPFKTKRGYGADKISLLYECELNIILQGLKHYNKYTVSQLVSSILDINDSVSNLEDEELNEIKSVLGALDLSAFLSLLNKLPDPSNRTVLIVKYLTEDIDFADFVKLIQRIKENEEVDEMFEKWLRRRESILIVGKIHH